eukprot:scaffold89064_cov66-Phaeocystis_antarctica.AAC.2
MRLFRVEKQGVASRHLVQTRRGARSARDFTLGLGRDGAARAAGFQAPRDETAALHLRRVREQYGHRDGRARVAVVDVEQPASRLVRVELNAPKVHRGSSLCAVPLNCRMAHLLHQPGEELGQRATEVTAAVHEERGVRLAVSHVVRAGHRVGRVQDGSHLGLVQRGTRKDWFRAPSLELCGGQAVPGAGVVKRGVLRAKVAGDVLWSDVACHVEVRRSPERGMLRRRRARAHVFVGPVDRHVPRSLQKANRPVCSPARRGTNETEGGNGDRSPASR